MNITDLATKIIDEQEQTSMEKLILRGLSSDSDQELYAEEKNLINALMSSGITQLIELDL